MRILTAGESHGRVLTGIIEGVPAGVDIAKSYVDHQLRRRQQGYGRGGRMRIESDAVDIVGGVRYGRTTGAPIVLQVRNIDHEHWLKVMAVDGDGAGVDPVLVPRPGHSDYVGVVKYRHSDIRNVIERASARETAIRVACATVVRKFLEDVGIFVGSHVTAIGPVGYGDRSTVDRKIARYTKASCGAYKVTEEADLSEVRMLDPGAASKAIAAIRRARKAGDTLGGIFEVIVTGVPIGLGSYVQADRKLDGAIAQAVMAIPAIKGVEFGDGFANARKPGSHVHDAFVVRGGKVGRSTNRAGGIEGGVTNGEPIIIRGAMKPIATLAVPLPSINIRTGKASKGRYERSDACAVPAAGVIAEAIVAPVLANAFLEKYGGDSLSEIRERYRRVGAVKNGKSSENPTNS
ncbi:MAG: chorismate synthase [Bacteroidetes bacterium]|nr:chorismate synthase [Bacteroidota bacterium]